MTMSGALIANVAAAVLQTVITVIAVEYALRSRARAVRLAADLAAATARADAAEAALAAIRIKRSRAVSKGNRTRAEKHRARIRATTGAVRAAVQRKRALKKTPQEDLPL